MKSAAALLLFFLLSGCASQPVAPETVVQGELPALQGYVVDEALRPLAGANVTIATANATAVTDLNGHYAFATLVGPEALVAVAQLPGFHPLGKSVQLSAGNSTMLNFTLVSIPLVAPFMEQDSFNGFLSCQAVFTADNEDSAASCAPAGAENVNRWEFHVQPDVAGIVIETSWVAKSQLAQFLNVTVETVGLGDQDATLSTVEGGSILRAAVTKDQSAKYYPQGGTVRVTITAATNTEDQEQAAGAAVAAQQEFQVVASVFYVAPPDPTYSAANA